jgi:MFS family permease
MSAQERRSLISLVSNVLIFGIFFAIILGQYQDGRFDGEDASRLIGQAVLWLIGAQIVAAIVGAILLAIITAVVTGRNPEPDVTDERDKLIELRALRVSFYLFGAAFVGVILAMALGTTFVVAFLAIIISLAVADAFGNVVRIWLYRRGF